MSVTLSSRERLRVVRLERARSTILARKSAGYGGLGLGTVESSTHSGEDSTKRINSTLLRLSPRSRTDATERDQLHSGASPHYLGTAMMNEAAAAMTFANENIRTTTTRRGERSCERHHCT